MKKLIISTLLIFVILSNTSAYNMTSSDNLLIKSTDEKIEKVIKDKWEKWWLEIAKC